jgi:DNA-binding transcriptional LysR family regulator
MESRFLETFIMVADSGSIAETARRLNITAAGVAQRIRALESEFGSRLLIRSGQRVRPTEAGIAILADSRRIIADLRDLKSIAANDRPAGELRFGATGSATSGLLPAILSLLTEEFPQIEVRMISGNGAELYQKMTNGELDAAIIPQPPFVIPKVFDWRTLREEHLVVVAPGSVRARDPHAILESEPFIRPRRNSWVGQLVDGYLRQAGIRPRERFELDTLEAIVVMVDQGLGVTLVHDWAPPWPEGLSVRKIPIPANSFGRRLGLIWTRASPRVRLVRAFLGTAVTALARDHAPRSKSDSTLKRKKKTS